MRSSQFKSGVLLLCFCLEYGLVRGTATTEAVVGASTEMSSQMGNGLSALEIKIEAEQIQDENNELLQRIINLADEIMKETDDMIGELASEAGEQVLIDAEQANAYCVDHSSSIKEIAYKLWKDGKNITVTIEDIAEMILDYESEMQMTEAPVKRRRRSATGASTPVVPLTTAAATEAPAATIAPVDIEGEASEIVKLADQSRSEFDRELENIITLANEMKVVMAFQADNIYENEEAVQETQEDIRDAEEEVIAFCDRIVDTAVNIIKQNTRSMDMITEYAESIDAEDSS